MESNQLYDPTKDLDNENNENKENDGNMKNFLSQMINDELAEPEIMSFCGTNKRALDMVKLCVNYIKSKDWIALRNYLTNSIDYNKNINDMDQETSVLFFVKSFYLGVAHFKHHNYELALSAFNDALIIYNYFQINYNIALCYIKMDNLENAAFHLEKVTKTNKNFFFAYYNLIRIYLKKNNVSDAYVIYRDFSDLIKKDKENQKNNIKSQDRLSTATFNALKLFYKLGAECCFAKALYTECVLTILEALKFNPEDPDLWCLYAKVFIIKKSFEFAKPLLLKVLEINPNYKEAVELLDILDRYDK